jgi:predicted AlkP superfamily pyrophosphatase or phosphodiesterase
VIDQFRYDYLTRFRGDYKGGLDRLLRQGAVFTNANYAQSPTVTAVGHSIFMSGAMPAVSGIVNNRWYDRQLKKEITSVCDWNEKITGAPAIPAARACTDEDPASPRRLLVSTIGDELRDARDESKVIGVSLKARAAILPSGHRANSAYWFDIRTGSFVTSTYYRSELPAWASSFNDRKQAEKFVSQKWPEFPSWDFKGAAGSPQVYSKIPASPWGNELVEGFAEAALSGEKLGQGDATDMLTVSFSSNDYVGHAVGPDAPEVRDMAIRVDALIGKLLALIDRSVGLQNTVVVLTADHGVSPAPGTSEKRRMPGVYVAANAAEVVKTALNDHFGQAGWIESGGNGGIWFNGKTLEEKKVTAHDVYQVAREAILAKPELHAVRVYDREQLSNGIAGDSIARSFVYGFFPRESPDLSIVFEPYALIDSTNGTTHFSPYGYDRHVPVIFMGPGVKTGRYNGEIQPNDIAPTLATMLDIETPSGSSGRVLTEMMQ